MNPRAVDIIGIGPTVNGYGWPDDHEKWSFWSAYPLFKDRVDCYFAMHKHEKIDGNFVGRRLTLDSYPIDDVINFFDSSFFTCSTAFMIALAIMEGFGQIGLHGIDMENGSEYAWERPCVAYWIGQARARRIVVETSNGFCDPVFLYGYDDEKRKAVSEYFERKRRFSEKCFLGHKAAGNEVIAAGFYGKQRAYEIAAADILGDE